MAGDQTNRAQASGDRERELKASVRKMWALGDYHRFATSLVWEIGAALVEACGIVPGRRVLDVAAGSGNTAIQAAEAGGQVVASDLTPENFDAGRAEARTRGVELDWVEADAEAPPFADGEFDVVTSSFGAMWAPDQQAVADELVRVCRPGGTIGMANFTPEGLISEFLGVFGPYVPAPAPGALPPTAWGSEDHVQKLFGDRLDPLELTRREYVERSPTPEAYWAFYRETFGPAVAVVESLADRPKEAAAFERDFLEFATRANRGAPGGDAEYHFEYLLVVGHKRRD